MLKEQKGITLIALVITIIVLVILVGVTVSVTINSGLIPNSKTAVQGYDKAQTNEMNTVNDVEKEMKDNWDSNVLGNWVEE